jgi:ATP-dependent helicase/nuclease subunit A
MNLHKAKGLEAPVVFLANPVGSREHAPSRHVERIGEEGPKGYFLFNKPRGEYVRQKLSQPLDWEKTAEEEKKYQIEEEARLMYVASTRARNLLIISTYEETLPNRAWEVLDECLSEVSDLEIPSRSKKGERKILKISPGAFEKGKKVIRSLWSESSKPSYAVDTVTSLAKKDIEIPIRKQSGYGMSWGRMVHGLLEAIGRGALETGLKRLGEQSELGNRKLSSSESMDALDILIENALTIEEWDPSEKPVLRKLIESILASEFWQRALKAKRRFVEVPFSLKASGLELGRKDKLPVILTGVIDLVFQESGGWVIADYKSDEVGGPEHLQSLLDYYAPQVKLYSRFWSEITGEAVKETGLFFIDLNKWIPVL